MAGFPPNPDDSELWLPYGFFNEVPSRLCSHRLDDLAQHFAALTLLKQHRNLSKLPLNVSPNLQVTHTHSLSLKVLLRSLHGCFNLVFLRLFFLGCQRLRHPVQHGLANPLSQSQGRFTLSNGLEDVRGVYGCKTGLYHGGGSELFYEYQLLKPTKPQVYNTKPET